MRYMRCFFDSTGPIFNLKFFPLYRVGLRNFRRICARALYDRACLNLNNSKRWRPTPEFFADLVHTYVCYEKLLCNPRSVATFLGRVPLKTQHSGKVNFLAQILKGVKLSRGRNSQISDERLLLLSSSYGPAKLQADMVKDKYRRTFFRGRLTH